MSSLYIRPVHSTGDLRRFIAFPYKLYRDEPNWVPPLRLERRRFLDRRRNPFFDHGRAEYFLALRAGAVVGRISAQVDDNFQRFQDNSWGWFGFFECENDPETAAALLDRAEQWLRGQGCDRMVGPADFTTNDECGILLEGHERTPLILSPWTHRYYPALFDGAGMTKAADLLMYELDIAGRDRVAPVIWRLAENVQERYGIVVRPFRKRDLDAEVARFIDVYHSAWEQNWGFVPLTEREIRNYAKSLKPFLDENWSYIAELDGETIGAALTLPDYNQALIKMGGRVLPFGWLRFLRARKKIDRVRVLALGVRPEWQHTGVAAKFYERHFDAATRTPQTSGEMGWVLEQNRAMNRALEAMGGTVVRRFRLYERELFG